MYLEQDIWQTMQPPIVHHFDTYQSLICTTLFRELDDHFLGDLRSYQIILRKNATDFFFKRGIEIGS